MGVNQSLNIMSTELEKLLDGDEKETQKPASKTDEEIKSETVRKEEERLANLQKAIAEANAELKSTRKAAKEKGVVIEEEELPKIDLTDPSSQAWDKHFSDKVDPLKVEMDKEKEEIRTFALQEFLADKPNISNDPEKLKKIMAMYEKVRTASERTVVGVIADLKKAYAAEYADEIIGARRDERIDEARADAIFSDIAVSRGSSSIPTERERTPHLTREDELILAKWGLSADEWIKMKKAQSKK